MNKLIIGSMQSIAPNGLVGALKSALADNANAMMVYLSAPSSTRRRPIEDFDHQAMWQLAQEHNLNPDHFIVHAPYIINIATSEPAKQQFALSYLVSEIKRAETCGFKTLVLHPGAHKTAGAAIGIANAINILNAAIEQTQTVKIALETMAGKGSEIGVDIDQLAVIIKGIKQQQRIAVCLDTCHLHDSGVNVADFDAYLDLFEEKIGIAKIAVVHLNDSHNNQGEKKDRHANIGQGRIGLANLVAIANNQRLKDVAKILETPYVNNRSLYKEEIQLIKDEINNLAK